MDPEPAANVPTPDPDPGYYLRAVARLPQVSSSASAAFLQMSFPGPGASPFSALTAEASPAGDEGVSIDRVKVVAGRLFDPADPHAVMIDQQVADREHLRPGGTLRLIEDGVHGLLVPPGDPGRLALAVERLLRDRALAARLGAAARRRAQERYSREAMVRRFERFYHDVVGGQIGVR